jgi:hypothetical protein
MSKNKRSYYGPFFWIAAVSFVVPIVVAAKAFHEVKLTSKPTPHPDASGVDHQLWDYLLKSNVESGLIDYDGVSRDHLFQTYLRQLSEADASKLVTPADNLALLCNAYNAFVINGVITHQIHGSVMDYQLNGKGFFDIEEHILFGKTISLNYLEHEMIRKNFQEPRVHVALVCAAKSCPTIRPEAFVGKRLAVQLEDQSIQFANNPGYVAFDSASNTLRLSQVLNWYASDWDHHGGYLPWLGKRTNSPSLKEAVERAARGEVRIAFFDYDWSLNSQNRSSANEKTSPEKPSASFGSGSVPNQ